MTTCRSHLKHGDILMKRYRIKAFLGSGGMSTVYLSEDLHGEGRHYAVKESRLAPKLAHQLMIEAKTLRDLDHPHLPRVRKLMLSGDREYFYIVQDYIEGITLAKLFLKNKGMLPSSVVLEYLVQICDILDYLHTEKIVYKDLKPGNLMVDRQGKINLVDFGIAQRYGENQAGATLRVGTIGFAAPEQYEGRATDARTDLYSFGALMFYLLSGGRQRVRCKESLHKLRPDLPKKLHQCIERLTRVCPEERIQHASEVRQVLEQVLKRMKRRKKTPVRFY